jgi:SIT4-associating protein SAP185/190
LSSGFSSNVTNTLANAGIGNSISAEDSLAMSEGTVGQAFEINSGISGFGDGDDDEDMEDEATLRQMEHRSPFTDDEQVGELSFDVDMDYR